MIDFFHVLGLPQVPWLDETVVRERFIELSRECHPDRVFAAEPGVRQIAQDRYTQLNSAYAALRDPRARLRHLLELNGYLDAAAMQQVPAMVAGLFKETAAVTREIDGCLARKRAASSALMQAHQVAEAGPAMARLLALRASINAEVEKLHADLQSLPWPETMPDSTQREAGFKRMREIYVCLSFFERWRQQLQEKLVQLTL